MHPFIGFGVGLSLLAAGCTQAGGSLVVSADTLATVRNAAIIACALTPTAEAIAKIYTDNKDVTNVETAVAILCALPK